MLSPNIDLEKPYQDACAREERYQAIVETCQENIWDELTDELDVEKFIYAYEPDDLLRDIIHIAAITKEKIGKLRRQGAAPNELLKLRLDAYESIFFKIDEQVERIAEIKAQRIYETE